VAPSGHATRRVGSHGGSVWRTEKFAASLKELAKLCALPDEKIFKKADGPWA
jgi:hypothetical protein